MGLAVWSLLMTLLIGFLLTVGVGGEGAVVTAMSLPPSQLSPQASSPQASAPWSVGSSLYSSFARTGSDGNAPFSGCLVRALVVEWFDAGNRLSLGLPPRRSEMSSLGGVTDLGAASGVERSVCFSGAC